MIHTKIKIIIPAVILVAVIVIVLIVVDTHDPCRGIDLSQFQADSLELNESGLLERYKAAESAARLEMVEQHQYDFDRIFFKLLLQGVIERNKNPIVQSPDLPTLRDIAEKFQMVGDSCQIRQLKYCSTLRGKALRTKLLAEALYDTGYNYYNQGNSKIAHRCFLHSFEYCKRINEIKLMADVSVFISKILCDNGELLRAVDWAECALDNATKAGYRYRIFWAYNSQMNALVDLGDYAAVISLGERAQRESDRFGDTYCTKYTLERLALSYCRNGEIPKAMEKYNRTLELIGYGGIYEMDVLKINCLIGLITVHTKLGFYSKADTCFQIAIDLFERIGSQHPGKNPPSKAILYQNIAELYRQLERYDSALINNRQALRLFTEKPNPLKEAMVLQSFGDIFRDKGNKDSTLYYYTKVNRYMKRWSSNSVDERPKRLEVEVNLSMGEVFAGAQNYSKAKHHYLTSLNICRQYNFVSEHVQSLLCLGNIERANGFMRQSGKYLEQALILAKELEEPILMANIYYSLSLNEQDKNPEAQLDLLKLAVQTCENTRRQSDDQFKILYFASVQEFYEAIIGRLYSNREFEKAYEYVQLSRARSLLEMAQNEIKNHPLNFREIQTALPPDIQIIEYKVTNDSLFIFVLDSDSFYHKVTNLNRIVLRKKISEYCKAIGALELKAFQNKCNKDPEVVIREYTQLGKQLYLDLIQPVVDYIHADVLYILADDDLNYVPFTTLVTPDSQYMVQKYTLVRAVCASHLVQLLQRPPLRAFKKDLTLFAAGNPAGDLTDAEKEIIKVGKMFPVSHVLLQSDVSEQKVRDGFKGTYDVFHFATHAVKYAANPEYSFLHLGRQPVKQNAKPGFLTRESSISATDDILTAKEIAGLDLTGKELITLSACQTAGGGLYPGEGFVGLTSAFLCAGAPSVVASLWAVDDEKTFLLISGFYHNWIDGKMSKVQALRTAQLDMIEEPTQNIKLHYPHPYFWAAFEVWGEYR
ncbi:CHAT domain-containing protein [candidate division KSB1 bacterium]|nr:CHAT domain-containing protein [candidate division KSB1 bacterium]